VAAKKASFTLTNTSLTSSDGLSLSLNGITKARLTDTAGGHGFGVGGWTGAGFLADTASTTDSINATKNAGFTLTNTSLTSTDGMALSLKGISKARLTDTAGGNSFGVGGWTGTGSLTDTGSIADSVKASKNAGFTLSNTALSSTDGMVMSLIGITKATLTGTGSGRVFTVTGWRGTGSLTGTSAIVTAAERVNTTLTEAALRAGTMSLSLAGFTKANLTVMTTSGQPSLILDASSFTGTTDLTAGGSGNAILFGGSGNGGKLTAMGTGNNILIGGSGTDTLTDTSGGHNILIGSGGSDTITGNGKDILISGTTSYDSNTSAHITALDAILAEWASSDSYATRISKIMAGMGSGGAEAFNATTVKSDGVANTLGDGSQASQNNWFFASSQDTVTKKSNETETIID
jgi:hypothetical protein